MGNIDQQFNKVFEKFDDLGNKFVKLETKVDNLQKTLEGHIEFTNERFIELEDKIEGVENSLGSKIANTKLELLNKLVTKEKVYNHEIRIQKLETKVA